MKAIVIVLLSLVIVNCGKKNFSANVQDSVDNTFHHDDTVNNTDPNACPRYDMVITSTDSAHKSLNYTYTFNGQMTDTSILGTHKITFGDAKYSSCSGSYTNSTISASLDPLQVTEDMTSYILITHGAVCASNTRSTNIQVFDSATNSKLFDENDLRAGGDPCEFGYTDDGQAMRDQLLQLADGVAGAKGAACN